MFKATKELMIKMFQIPLGWRIWLLALMAANIVAPLFFFDHIEAVVTFIAVNIGFFTAVLIYKRQGYTRLLAAMHWPWIFLLPFLWVRLEGMPSGDPLATWIGIVLALDLASLFLDAVDLAKYMAGDRQPII